MIINCRNSSATVTIVLETTTGPRDSPKKAQQSSPAE
jgi:hypothetical protein